MRRELPKINEYISKSLNDLVRVISNKGEQLGVMSLEKAYGHFEL